LAPTPPDTTADALLPDLIALYRWYRDWAETARMVITRRDYLIRLGMASRRHPKTEDDDPEPAPAPAPAPVSPTPDANL
jgi:hypothetical protein